MTTYMIGYDLNKSAPPEQYEALFEAIKGISGTWWHHLDSTWLVVTELSAVQVFDRLKPYIDLNDELLVTRVSPDAAWRGFKKSGSDWLHKFL